MACRRIVFTGDILRPEPNGPAPAQSYNIQWCRDLLGQQMAAATGLPVEMVACNVGGVQAGQIDDTAVAAIYATLGLPRTVQGWASLHGVTDLPEPVETYLLELFRDALVIGFELPPYLEDILRRHAIPYVDIIIHPVRFLDDIFFGLRSSDAASNAALAAAAISEEFIFTMAGLQTAAARRNEAHGPPRDSALLLLQTGYDRVLLADGRFVCLADYTEEIEAIAANVDTLLVKEHPLAPMSSQSRTILRAVRNAELTATNIYRLLASDAIERVVTLSSSVGVEARYFGKKTDFLFKPPNKFTVDRAVPGPEEYVGVFDAFLASDFWRTVLASITPTSPCSGVKVSFNRNRLRGSLQSFWGFEGSAPT